MQGNDSYYTNEKSKCLDNVHFARKEKSTNIVMVWIEIFNSGISKPLFYPSKSEDQSPFGHLCKRIYSLFPSVNITQTQIKFFDLIYQFAIILIRR